MVEITNKDSSMDTIRYLDNRWAHLFENKIRTSFINKNVLDLGCLDGYGTYKFIKYGANSAIGIDIDTEYIHSAQKEYPNIDFIIADIEDYDFEKYFLKVDVISCLGLIYLLKNPKYFLEYISSVKSIKTVIIEAINYKDNQELLLFENLKLLNINAIKNIFNENGWHVSFEKDFQIKTLNYKILNNLTFGDRIILIFEKN